MLALQAAPHVMMSTKKTVTTETALAVGVVADVAPADEVEGVAVVDAVW